jgi:hypothetical protein
MSGSFALRELDMFLSHSLFLEAFIDGVLWQGQWMTDNDFP